VPDAATERFAAAPAPLALQRIQSFLNTRSAGLPLEPDLLERPGSANAWLHTFDWPARPRLTLDDLTPLRELRQALQALVEDGPNPSETVVSGFSRQVAHLRWTMTIQEGQLALSAEGGGWRQIAGALLNDMYVAQQRGTWPRLKACRMPAPCRVVFYDSSKNQSRVWHNTSVCGNLTNLRASRARRRQDPS
jgi:hypothetical protein